MLIAFLGIVGLVGNFLTLIILRKQVVPQVFVDPVLINGLKTLYILQESTSSFNKLLMSLTAVDSILIKLYIIDSFFTRMRCEPAW